jgi:CDGSH-type Zn-finger protein
MIRRLTTTRATTIQQQRWISTQMIHHQSVIQATPMTKPRIVQLGPYEVELEADKQYSWCTCGLSTKQPFCDGKHKGSGYKSLKFKVNDKKHYYLCGCKNTKNAPFCDGEHNQCHQLFSEQQQQEDASRQQ